MPERSNGSFFNWSFYLLTTLFAMLKWFSDFCTVILDNPVACPFQIALCQLVRFIKEAASFEIYCRFLYGIPENKMVVSFWYNFSQKSREKMLVVYIWPYSQERGGEGFSVKAGSGVDGPVHGLSAGGLQGASCCSLCNCCCSNNVRESARLPKRHSCKSKTTIWRLW